ncbi:hypothetical protein OIE68_08175 [Nocardia vinacea]|uniref:Uncharacterized protein n=1 Tax=Nocardia vinacea TaxID=96468 RepID=A0ABZ1YR37_9NOCA|nr:hypothetical protein OIE68_08175 [Nocardia vinacea]
MTSDPESARVQQLASRAARAGYLLVRDQGWTLLDAEDGEALYSTASLDLIEQWLSQ